MKACRHERGQSNSATTEPAATECGKSRVGSVFDRAGGHPADGPAASGVTLAAFSPWRAGNNFDASAGAHRQHRRVGAK